MKICLISLAERGGMIHYIINLANELSKKNDVSVILAIDKPAELSDDIKIFKIELPKTYFSWSILRFNELVRLINKINPDVIHILSNHPWFIFVLPFLRRKYPVLTTVHDVEMHLGEWHPVWAFSSKILTMLSNKLFVHGNWAKIKLEDQGISNQKISVIQMGPLSPFKENNKIFNEGSDILFFGRIEEYKGLEYLLKAEKIIKSQIDPLKVVIAGEGDMGKYQAYMEDSESFEIHNYFIPDERIPEFFQDAKIVVLPYKECTQTGIIPIAYAFNKPVVVTDVGCIPEIVENGKTGLIVEAENEKALAEAIIKLLNDDNLRKQMGNNAYAMMNRDLSWENIGKITIEIYEETISEGIK